MGLYAPLLHAQTLFQLRDTIPTLSRYRSVEECLAAVQRVSDSLSHARPEFLDTMPFRKGAGRDSSPTAVVATAQQCARQFNPDSVVLTGVVETYTDWMQLYLTADRDDAAAVVAQRRLTMARHQPKVPGEVYDVLFESIRVYGSVRPMRWDKVQETAVQLETQGVASDSFKLFRVYQVMFKLADSVEDTIVKTKMAERILALGEFMPPDIRNSPVFSFAVAPTLYAAVNFLTHAARMDSLRHGPDAYVTLVRANLKKLAERSKFPFLSIIGEHAVPVTAEFWFSSSAAPVAPASDHPRPAPGKISLVVFLRQGCNARVPPFVLPLVRRTHGLDCWGPYSILRRLGQRYPSLEITLVSRTEGYNSDTGPMTPAEEATILRQWWLGFHRLPAALAVTTTEFFRLERPDRRRIDQPVPNDVNYGFGRVTEVANGWSYLIDTNGMVIFETRLSANGEQTLTEMLDVMMQRGK